MFSQFFHFNNIAEMRGAVVRAAAVVVVCSLLLVNLLPPLARADEAPPSEEITTETVTETPPDEGTNTQNTQNTETSDGSKAEDADTGPGGDGGAVSGGAAIQTGDASAEGNTENVVNTNDTNTDESGDEGVDDTTNTTDAQTTTNGSDMATTTPQTSESSGSTTEGNATTTSAATSDNAETPDSLENSEADTTTPSQATSTSTPELLTEDDSSIASSTPHATTTVENVNGAEVSNTAVIEAGTGNNEAAGGGSVAIGTGNAYANINILNVVNTNIFNSRGLFLFLNALFGSSEHLDIRDLNLFGGASSGPCRAGCGALGTTLLRNQNNATVTNDVLVTARTGVNTASATGSAAIGTGNAYAAANIVNIANTNIVNSNYLLLTFNNFDSWLGDVVFPAAGVIKNLFGAGGGVSGNTSIVNNNDAQIANNASTTADTGGNSAEGSAAAVITGNAGAGANVINQANTNIFGPNSFSVLFRVHGNWTGDVFNAPEGFGWRETPFGTIEFFFDDDGKEFSADAGGSSSTAPSVFGGGLFGAENANRASILNNVNVLALTGENKVTSGGDAAIGTGNAYAAANIINVANTNVVGRNWILAIVNIFGDWNGNVSFGMPDLWVGAQADVGNASPGTPIKFIYTVLNNGDAPASEVHLESVFENDLIFFGGEFDPKSDIWNVGTLLPGEMKEIELYGIINNDLPHGDWFENNMVRVTSRETDNETFDNTEELALALSFSSVSGGAGYGAGPVYTPDPVLNITKQHFASSTVSASSTVPYQIVITNDGPGSAYNAKLIDILRNEDGVEIHREEWGLGEVYADEKIIVDYDVVFNAATPGGIYTNTAYVSALGGHPEFKYGYFADSEEVSTDIEVTAREEEPAEEEEESKEEDTEASAGALEDEEPFVPAGVVDDEAEEAALAPAVDEDARGEKAWVFRDGVSLPPVSLSHIYLPFVQNAIEKNANTSQLAFLKTFFGDETQTLFLLASLFLIILGFSFRENPKFARFVVNLKSFFF